MKTVTVTIVAEVQENSVLDPGRYRVSIKSVDDVYLDMYGAHIVSITENA